MNKYDVIIIGAGVYGLELASYFKNKKKHVLILEKEATAVSRSSYANQARVHRGYHYPRDTLTALRSRSSYKAFSEKYKECISHQFKHFYCIGDTQSLVTPKQFENFCHRIGAPLNPIDIKSNPLKMKRVQAMYRVHEDVFDAKILKDSMLDDLGNTVEILYRHKVLQVFKHQDNCQVEVLDHLGDKHELVADQVFNCSYASLNNINERSALPLLNLKFELAEICLVKMPESLSDYGLTVMCGPFFSFLPFPTEPGAHSLSHVRYTPHMSWTGAYKEKKILEDRPKSAFIKMVKDVHRYIDEADKIEYMKSLWEFKAKLLSNSRTDGRNILMKMNHGFDGYHCVLGSKIDNILELSEYLDKKGI